MTQQNPAELRQRLYSLLRDMNAPEGDAHLMAFDAHPVQSGYEVQFEDPPNAA